MSTHGGARSAVTTALALLAAVSPAFARDLSFEERVKAQEAIERVYYSHQIGATKPFEEAVPRAVLEKKVSTYLKESVALDRVWHTPLTGGMLRQELERITRDTRFPDRLKEIYAALGNDAFVVEECFARPTLVDRLARSFHGGGSLESGDWDTWWSATAASIDETGAPAVALGRSLPVPRSTEGSATSCPAEDTWSTDGLWHLSPHARWDALGSIVWTGSVVIVWGGDGAQTGGRYDPLIDVWTVTSVAGAPVTSDGSPAVWTGAEMIVSGSDPAHSGRYDPLSDTWHAVSAAGGPSYATSHTAVWTGSRMLVWCGMAIHGASYDPVADAWAPISLVGAPSQRELPHAVWTGSEMIIWGGFLGSGPLKNGQRYDPISDSWRSMSSTNGWGAEQDSAVWTGTEMIAWGGYTAHPPLDTGTYYNQGSRYDPAADVWTPTTTVGAPTPRDKQIAVWAGNRMLIWGGQTTFPWLPPQVGGRYDPSTDSWQPMGPGDPPVVTSGALGVSTGDRMFLWGGKSDRGEAGGRYDPSTDSWTPVSSWPGPSRREDHTAVWTGSEMIVWGGQSTLFGNPSIVTGGRFDPLTASWVPTSTSGAPTAGSSGLSLPAAVWTGAEMVVWSGGNSPFGGRYNPRTDTWSSISQIGAPQPRVGPTAVWTGTKMIVWGGRNGRPDESADNHFATGGIYDPVADTWSATSALGAPEARAFHTAVWTGSRMVIWGGGVIKPTSGSEVYFQTGGRYDPITDAWVPTSLIGAPSARYDHASVWTGLEMVTFGGRQIAPFGDGGAYDPASDTWRVLSPTSAPAARYQHTAVWTGREMVVWGGSDGTATLGSGGRYFPGTDSWSATSTVGTPPGAQGHTVVWTGGETVVWGGREQYGAISRDGGAYFLDVDGDGAGGACDCQPNDPTDRKPAEPGPLLVGKTGMTANLTWPAVGDTDSYSVSRGDLASKGANEYGTCQANGLPTPSYDDTTVPAPGQGFFYLVQAQNYDCGLGSLGTTSNEQQRTNLNPGACGGVAVTDAHASGQSTVLGTVTGTLANTQSPNDQYETITEVLSSGGNPSSRFSELEQRFTVTVGSGTKKELHVEGFRSNSTDGDDFRFEYSTDGVNFTPVTLTLPFADDNIDRVVALPGSLTGTVTIRVVDTDQTAGHQALDALTIDELWIRVVP